MAEPKVEEDVDIMDRVWNKGKKYSLSEFKEELKLEIQSRKELDGSADVSKCVLALGEAGIGKTQAIRQTVEEVGGEYVMYHHGATMEEDNAGTPYQEQSNGDRVTRIAIPDHLACFYREPHGATGVLVIEEIFTGSTTAHQNQARQFIDKRFGLTRMKPGWHLVGTSNPATADFHTVKAVDKALAKRMVWFPIEATAAEKLTYWADKMDDLLYKFLVLWHLQKKDIDFVDATDSRTWMNLSDSIARRRDPKTGAVRCNKNMLYRLVFNNVNESVANAFQAYLVMGDNPDEYPIGHMDILRADDKQIKVLVERIERWTQNKRAALIGATKWSLCGYLHNGQNHHLVDDRGVANIAAFLKTVGSRGFADLSSSMLAQLQKSPLARKVLEKLEGSELETKLAGLLDTLEEKK
jgi:hypothetical protein